MKNSIFNFLYQIGICHKYLTSVHAINCRTQEPRTFRYEIITFNEAIAKQLSYQQYERDWGLVGKGDYIIKLDPNAEGIEADIGVIKM